MKANTDSNDDCASIALDEVQRAYHQFGIRVKESGSVPRDFLIGLHLTEALRLLQKLSTKVAKGGTELIVIILIGLGFGSAIAASLLHNQEFRRGRPSRTRISRTVRINRRTQRNEYFEISIAS